MKYFLTILVTVAFTLSGLSQDDRHTIKKDEQVSSPPASIDDVAWIAGYWHGEALGGKTEEVWTEPLGNSMMGSFKLSHGDKIAFYELCVIREIGETIILQLKHFNDDLKGWEEKDVTVDFPLVRIEKDKVFFDQFTFEKISEDEMHSYVVISEDGEAVQEIQFKYSRKK